MKQSKTGDPVNQNLEKVLLLLETLSATGPMTVSEISRAMSVSRTTAYTTVNTLCANYYLERNPLTGKYTVGYKLFQLGSNYPRQYSFLSIAERHVLPAMEQWKIKVNLSVLKYPLRLVILSSKEQLRSPALVLGNVLPAHCSASGKLLLAHLPQEELAWHLQAEELRRVTPHTITDRELLEQQFAEIRGSGYALETEELYPGRCCIAAPLRDRSGGVMASVSFSCTKEQLDAQRKPMTKELLALALNISTELGFDPIRWAGQAD